MTRQISRQTARAEAKADASMMKQVARRAAKNALLACQTEREKTGVYTGRSVASAIALSRSRVNKRKVQKGKAFGRILSVKKFGSRDVSYHATKGYRSSRA